MTFKKILFIKIEKSLIKYIIYNFFCFFCEFYYKKTIFLIWMKEYDFSTIYEVKKIIFFFREIKICLNEKLTLKSIYLKKMIFKKV